MDHGNVEEDESFQLPPLVPPSPREDPDAVPEGVASDADHDPACVAEEPQPHINERAPSEDSDSSIDEETAIAASTKSPAMLVGRAVPRDGYLSYGPVRSRALACSSFG
jgi:hypothetical protein